MMTHTNCILDETDYTLSFSKMDQNLIRSWCQNPIKATGLFTQQATSNKRQALFTQDTQAYLHANPLMLCATCVNTPIYYRVFHNLHAYVARCSASFVNGALECDLEPSICLGRVAHCFQCG